MNLNVQCEREEDGRWLAEVRELPGVLTYGASADEAMAKAQILALRVLAERLGCGESRPSRSRSRSLPRREPVALDEGSPGSRGARSWRLAGQPAIRLSSHTRPVGLARLRVRVPRRGAIGPRVLARIAEHTGLKHEDL